MRVKKVMELNDVGKLRSGRGEECISDKYQRNKCEAFVAQSVERKSHNLKVARSSPAESKYFSLFCY